jgi:NDP-sugar pyrophosphorylase family protein
MGKKRVSLTLEEELVERVDERADQEGFNRSEMVEDIIETFFEQRDISTAVVFAGDPEAKAMDDFKGRPVLEHIIDRLSSSGIARIVLLVGPNQEEIEGYFGSEYSGTALEYVSEEKPQGTAAALSKVEERVDGTFLVLNGHVITEVDIGEMLRTHRDEGRMATMALTTVEDPSAYGVAKMKGRKILGFEEKPEDGEEPSRLINAGTYVLEEDIFDELDEDSIETVFRRLASDSELAGYIYGGEWIDVSEPGL